MTIEKRNELIIKFMPLANKLARKHSDFEEARSVAFMGLIDAAENYDCNKGSFYTYAHIKINGSIKDYFRKIKKYKFLNYNKL